MKTVRIDAAILSLAHSFTADNHDCGTKLDLLTINGAIAQKYRGAVGTTGGTGFTKNYNYDDRLRYRSPPYFLEPVAASWHVIRSNEQVPAALSASGRRGDLDQPDQPLRVDQVDAELAPPVEQQLEARG